MLVDESLRRGLPPDEARRHAREKLGHVTRLREDRRDARSLPQLEGFLKDCRYAARTLARSPGFTLVAVVTAALGIGVNTTLFGAFNAIALKPLPVRDPSRIVRFERWFENGYLGDIQYAFSYPEYRYFSEQSRSVERAVAVSWPVPVLATLIVGEPETLQARLVSGNYFSDLHVTAFLGRTFDAEEDRAPGANPVAVLSYRFWRDRFQSDPSVLGRIMKVNDTAFTVVGVTPEEFIGTGIPATVPDFWAPVTMQEQIEPGRSWLGNPLDRRLQILARVKEGLAPKQAQAEIAGEQKRFAEINPARERTLTVTLEPARFLPNTDDPRFQAVVALVMMLVAMVLFIACANLANMLLARSAARRKELTVRLALGAGRMRVIRQLLTESILLALAGGAVGFLISIWAVKLVWLGIQQLLAGPFGPGTAFVLTLSPDFRVFAYALSLSLVTGIVFGLSPALRFSRPDLATGLNDDGAAFGQRLDRSRLRGILVAAQVGASLMLLITAGLLARGLVRSQAASPGYETRTVYLANFNHGSDAAKALALQKTVLERLSVLPQVRAVTVADRIPMAGTTTLPIETEDTRLEQFSGSTLAVRIAPQYFETLGIGLTSGRNFTQQEMDSGARVAIVTELTARHIWPDQNPLGRRFRTRFFTGRAAGPWEEFSVIGVAKSTRTANLTRLDPFMTYLPLRPRSVENVLVRVDGDRNAAVSAIRRTLASIDRNIAPSLQLISLEDGPLHSDRVQAKLFALSAMALAILALALASVGIYGVMSYLVTRQTKQIGILMALGATAGDVLRSVILQALWPVVVGAIVGISGAAAIGSALRFTLIFPGSADFFYGVSSFDPLTFIGLSALLGFIALAASAVPAYRAVSVDPMVALRCD